MNVNSIKAKDIEQFLKVYTRPEDVNDDDLVAAEVALMDMDCLMPFIKRITSFAIAGKIIMNANPAITLFAIGFSIGVRTCAAKVEQEELEKML